MPKIAWINEYKLIFASSNNPQIGIIDYINKSSKVISDKSQVLLNYLGQPFLILSDTAIIRTSEGYMCYSIGDEDIKKCNELPDAGVSIAASNNEYLIYFEEQYIIREHKLNGEKDSIYMDELSALPIIQNKISNGYFAAETGEDSFNIYRYDFDKLSIQKITSNGSDHFIGNVSNNF